MEPIEQQLSRLMDSDLNEQEKASLIEQLLEDPEKRAIWERYQLVRNVMTNKLSPGDQIVKNVREAIDKENLYSPEKVKEAK